MTFNFLGSGLTVNVEAKVVTRQHKMTTCGVPEFVV